MAAPPPSNTQNMSEMQFGAPTGKWQGRPGLQTEGSRRLRDCRTTYGQQRTNQIINTGLKEHDTAAARNLEDLARNPSTA